MFLFEKKKSILWGALLCSLLLSFLPMEASAQENIPAQIPISAFCLGLPGMGPVFSWSYSELPLKMDGYSIKATLKKTGASEPETVSIDFETLFFEPINSNCNCDEAHCSLEITVTDAQGSIVAHGEGIVQKIEPSLPVISVVTDDLVSVCSNGFTGEGCYEKLPADISIYDASLKLLHNERCGIEVRGNTSRSFPKKQYSMEMRIWNDEEGEEEGTDAFHILDMGQGEDWVLNGSWFDRSFIANKLAFELFRSFSPLNFSVQSRYVELFVNHEYMGLYLLSQSIKREYIDRFFNDGFSKDKTGEKFIVSIDSGDPELNYEDRFMPFFAAESNDVADGLSEFLSTLFYELKYPSDTSKLDLLQERNLIDYFLSFEDAVLGFDYTGSGSIFDYLSLSNSVDYMILQELFLCFDSYIGNFYLYRNQSDGDMYFTVWDYDRALGNDRNTYWLYLLATMYNIDNYGTTETYLLDRFKELGGIDFISSCLSDNWDLAEDMEVVIPRTQMFWEMLHNTIFKDSLTRRINYLRENGNPMSEFEIKKMIATMVPSDNELIAINGTRLTKTALDRNFDRWPGDSLDYVNLSDMCAVQFVDHDNELKRIENFLIQRAEILGDYMNELFNKAGDFNYRNSIEGVQNEN